MVNKRWMNRGRALLLCALMLAGQTAYAEEKRLGDFIYVPAMTVQPQTGSIALRVEGLALDADADQPRTVDALPGAVFGPEREKKIPLLVVFHGHCDAPQAIVEQCGFLELCGKQQVALLAPDHQDMPERERAIREMVPEYFANEAE